MNNEKLLFGSCTRAAILFFLGAFCRGVARYVSPDRMGIIPLLRRVLRRSGQPLCRTARCASLITKKTKLFLTFVRN